MTYILFIMVTVGVNARQYTETEPDSTYYSRALELILKRDYEKARSVLHQGLTFATGEMRIKSIQKIGLSWYFEGCVLKLQNKNKEAYQCFIEARKSFQEISDKGDEMSVLKQMAEIEKDSILLMRLWKGITRWCTLPGKYLIHLCGLMP